MTTKTREEQLAEPKSLEERLADALRDYERQNEEWERVKAKLLANPNVRVMVPRRLIAMLDTACKPRVLACKPRVLN
jgi:hypothetical protein